MLQLSTVAAALRVNDFTFSHLGLADGLNSQRIYSLKQTSDGAVWLTTKSFVARYNGSSIESFNLTENTSKHNLIGCNPRFVQSTDGTLQVFDAGGRIYKYNYVQNRFDVVADATMLFKHANQLNDVFKEGDTYWLAMSEGIYMLRNGKIVPVASDVYANCIIRGAKGVLLFGTRQGVKSLNSRHNDASKNQLLSYLSYDVVNGYYDSCTKRLWLGTYNQGLIIVDSNGVCDDVEGIPHYPVRSIAVYDSSTMLVGVDGYGVYQVSRLSSTKNTASQMFNANRGTRGMLHGNGIYALLVDTWSNIFIGSYSGGIDIARPIGSIVSIYKCQHNNEQTLINDHVNSVAQLSSSALVMGTDNGISVLNPLSGDWKDITHGIVVLSLCFKPDGGLLAATYGDGVYEISAKGKVRQLYGAAELGDDHIHDLLYDRNGHLWIACQDAQLVEVTQEGFRYYPVYNVKSLALLPDDRIAAGTIIGIYMVTPGQKEIKELHYFSSDPNTVNRHVLDLFIQDERYMYIATDGGGLYVYDLRNGDCRVFTIKDGLPSNTVTSVISDNLGRLWLATDRGMSFAYLNELDKIFDVNYCYGLQREYSRGAAIKLADGNLLFGSEAGAVVVNPHHVHKLNYTTNLRFTGVNCTNDDSEQFNEQAAKMLDERILSLSYQQRTFELYIEGINLRYQFDIAYQYKIGNGNWSPLTTQQYIRFVSLEPGTHRLIVRAVSKTSHIVLDEQELIININRPWWNSWWMWCIYISLVALLLYGIWWTYGLHTRYMRLVMGSLEQENEDKAITSQSVHKEKVESQVSTVKKTQHDGCGESESATVSKQNAAFVEIVTQHILNHISDMEFSIDCLCKEMAMSRTMFYIKLKSYTGKSPQEFIRIIRLERAAILLRAGNHVAKVAEEVGFDNAKYFSTAFKKYFGTSPSKFK